MSFVYLQELQISFPCAAGQRREREGCTCGRKENCSSASAPPSCCPLPLLCFSLLSLSPSIPALCPGNVPTREGEEEESRGRGEPACQTGGRGGSRERIACGGGTARAEREVGRTTRDWKKIDFFFASPKYILLLLIKLGVKVVLGGCQQREEAN